MASSADTNREEPLLKKKKKTEPSSDPSLPHDLFVSCLARLSRLHYPSLSLVSKSFKSLLASPELYKTRSLLDRTESFLYVCLQYPSDPNPRWFTLCTKPNRTTLSSKKKKEKKEPSGHVLAPVSFTNSSPVEWSDLIAVGDKLYAICGPITTVPCSNVSFLDCRTHTWLEAPSLRLAHTGMSFDGNMYLAGSYENGESLNCVEVFDIKTQTWKPVPSEKRKFRPKDMEGKVYMNTDAVSGGKGLTVKPKDMSMRMEAMEFDQGSFCMIEEVIYCYCFSGLIIWSHNRVRGIVKGLEGLPKFARYSRVQLVDYGGKLVVLWEKYLRKSGYKEKMIWCAVISLEKRGSQEMWGNVEWVDAVLRVPKSYKFVYAVTATI